MAADTFQIKGDSPAVSQLMFWRIVGHETLSRPSHYELTVLSTEGNIAAKDVLGRSFDVVIDFHDAAETVHQRHCQGYAVRFSRTGELGRYFRYQITLQSWFGLLSRRRNSRILQDMTSQAIFNAVADDSPIKKIKKFEPKSYANKKVHRYCTQFQESDYAFLSHLLEEEGVCYWFDAHDKAGTMIASTDSDLAHSPLPATDVLKYIPGSVSDARFNEITRFTPSTHLQTGKYASRDSDFKAIKQKLLADKADPAVHELSDLEDFEFGDYLRGDDHGGIANQRMQEHSSKNQRYFAHTRWPDVAVGRSFSYEDDPNQARIGESQFLIGSCSFVISHPGYESLQAKEEKQPISTVLQQALSDDALNADYRSEWLAQMDGNPQLQTGISGSRAFLLTLISANTPWRVPRLTPRMQMPGPQSGIVVGPAGEEIHADEFGRVKVHFHWDRYDASNEKSTAWIRVSQPWGGKGWGGYFIPRIGQEVIVDFMNGDPDRPLIMGRVYNDDQPIPFESHTQSGFRTRSTPGGTAANCNEFRFDDKMGSEQVYLHAEKNQDIEVENDETHWVGHDRTKTIDHDETNHIKHDRTETVDNDEEITVHNNRTERVDHNEKISIGDNRDEDVGKNETISIGDNRTETVGKNETINIGQNRSETVGGNESVSIKQNRSVNIQGSKSQSIAKNYVQTVKMAKMTNVILGYSINVGLAMNRVVGGFSAEQVGGYKQLNVLGGDFSVSVSNGSYKLTAAKEITLEVGKSSLVMKADGTVLINGSTSVCVTGKVVDIN
jgi:type VI secretion system secreted protein VgrG